ncbi:TolB-like translocation protein [Limnoglobus roseus]|uniref:Oligogalacturonate lyase n=1 Tax=Limnoglobus roseus TaxID=2598579 RepID=A0A5C1A8L0_9BACT|nr:hypothetical protein [Limnoglobus roseus]QEL13484.1 hypothetical protein PX52LOC_00341 [Limnoglobus roseus]
MPHPTRREWLGLTLAAAVGGPALARPDAIKLPARAVTKGPKHHWFGYYDKCPWDMTGRYLLAMENDFCDRQPTATDRITVGMVDLKDNDRFIPLDTTLAWSWQQGTMLQWLGSAPDREVIYNAFLEGNPAAVIRDVKTNKTRTLPRPIYAVSADGKQAVTLDFARLHRLRPGSGYASYKETFADDPAPEALGIWHVDPATGKDKQIISLKQLAAHKPDPRFTGAHHWVNHLQFNPGGSRFVFLHRWRVGEKPWSTRLYTAKPDGTDLRLHLDTGMVSHFDWRDDATLLAWVKPPTGGNTFALIDVATDSLTVVDDSVLTVDGHCSYSPDRKWILNDTYPDKDRLQWLMLFDPAKNRRYDLNQFASPKAFTGPVRCDLHPRWNRGGTQVCFDGCHDPQRQVYVVDVRDVVR